MMHVVIHALSTDLNVLHKVYLSSEQLVFVRPCACVEEYVSFAAAQERESTRRGDEGSKRCAVTAGEGGAKLQQEEHEAARCASAGERAARSCGRIT